MAGASKPLESLRNSIMVTNGRHFTNKLELLKLIASVYRQQFLSLHVAQDVAPEERCEGHVDDSEWRRNQEEVDSLSRKPEEARALKRGNELFAALFERRLLHLHKRHSGEEYHQQRGRQNELIEQQFPHNYLSRGAGQRSVEPLIPVVQDRRVNERSHNGEPTQGCLVDVLWR